MSLAERVFLFKAGIFMITNSSLSSQLNSRVLPRDDSPRIIDLIIDNKLTLQLVASMLNKEQIVMLLLSIRMAGYDTYDLYQKIYGDSVSTLISIVPEYR